MSQKKVIWVANRFEENIATSLMIAFVEFLPLEQLCANLYKQINTTQFQLSGTIKPLQIK